jgi:hypothetical protein
MRKLPARYSQPAQQHMLIGIRCLGVVRATRYLHAPSRYCKTLACI